MSGLKFFGGGVSGGGRRKVQVVSLGAGFDTFYFQLSKHGHRDIRYVEVDFPSVIKKKIGIISRSQVFKKYLVNLNVDAQNGHLFSDHYTAISCDLRKTEDLFGMLKKVLDTNLPVIVVSEMVLIYMDRVYSDKILTFFGKSFNESQVIIYESFNPHDEFGRKMVEKIKERGCPLRSIYDFDTLEKQEKRLIDIGYPSKHVKARDLLSVSKKFYNRRVMMAVERRSKEFLDEFFLFDRLMNHYCLLVGLKGVTSPFDPNSDKLFHTWFDPNFF